MNEILHFDRKPARGMRLVVDINAIDPQGMGIGPLPATLGPQRDLRRFNVKARHTVPGDRVAVAVRSTRKNTIEADVVEWLVKSTARVAPRCEHFGDRWKEGQGCGGCSLLMMSYEAQVSEKRKHVQAMLDSRKLGLEVLPALAAPEPWFYRNKMEFSFGHTPEGRYGLGLHPYGFKHDVLALRFCHLQSEASNLLVVFCRELAEERGIAAYLPSQNKGFLRSLTIREGRNTHQRMLIFNTTSDEFTSMSEEPKLATTVMESLREAIVDFAKRSGIEVTSIIWTRQIARKGHPTTFETHVLWGTETLFEQLNVQGAPNPLDFEIHPRAFFQTHTAQAETLYNTLVRRIRERVGSNAKVIDLYCGTGTIALCIAPFVESVVGYELLDEAVENAKANALLNHLDNVDFIAGDVGKTLVAQPGERTSVDLVVVDPPRSGLSEEAFRALLALSPPSILYVSCNPKSLVRDLVRFRDEGYRGDCVQPVDMFPHTAHMESVVMLTAYAEPVGLAE